MIRDPYEALVRAIDHQMRTFQRELDLDLPREYYVHLETIALLSKLAMAVHDEGK